MSPDKSGHLARASISLELAGSNAGEPATADALASLGGMPGWATSRASSPADTLNFVAKRTLDVLVSASLLLLLAPVMLAIAAAIRLDSPGPAIFRQLRVGRNRRRSSSSPLGGQERRSGRGFGRAFPIFKFRTMSIDSAPYACSPIDTSDPRITRIGRFLRQTCLDELPQLLNVLRGEMSLVGPRPEMPFLVSLYDSRQRRRLESIPGITGPWQIRGPRDRAIHEAIEWDLEYIERASLRTDFAILLETLRFIVRRRNR